MTQRKLSIGVVVDQLLAGGVQLSAIEQVKALNKLGHHAKLLILMKKKYTTDFSYLVKDVPYQYLSDSYPPLFRKTIKFPIFSFFSTLHLMSPILAPRVIKKGDYDILISLGTTTCLTTQAIFKKNQIPYIAIIHDPIIYILETVYSQTFLRFTFPLIKPLAKYFERSFVKDAKDTLIISKVHFDYIQKNYGIKPKILGLSTSYLKKLPLKRGNYLLSFGRWQKEKNPEFLLELLSTLPEAKLIVAGSWIVVADLKHFRSQIIARSLQKRVKIITHYSDKQLIQLSKQARFWLYPHFEAFGLAALEAASFGLPIIIPQKSGVTESFQHGVHGFFPAQVTIASYKNYVAKLLSDERLAFRMGLNAAELVKQHFSAEAISQELLKIINSALDLPEPARIFVLETGHAPGATLAGGDKLMEPMVARLPDKYRVCVIVPEIGANHWQKAGLKKTLFILKKNLFDRSSAPIPVFLTYLIRMFETNRILKNQLGHDLLYSSTNILPDILPGFLAKRRSTTLTWIARIHHLIPAPHNRQGKLVVNIVAYLMQILALSMIRKRADVIIVLNDSLQRELLLRGFASSKIRVLGAGIDFVKIDSQPILVGTKSYDGVYLGRLHPAKGVFDLIPIWERVVKSQPQVRLAVIGDGQDHLVAEIKSMIKVKGLAKNIFLVGPLPDQQVYSLMKKAKIFLFTDHEAGWGIAVAEAMACGLPIVGYDNGVLGSVYKKGYLKIPLANQSKFSQAVLQLLKNPTLRKKLATKAYLESGKYDWINTASEFNSILGKVV